MAFWNRKQNTITPEEQSRTALESAERLLGENPKAALRELDKLKGQAYALVTFGGAHHQRFAQVVREAFQWPEPGFEVRAVSWSTWPNYPTMADILALARETTQPILYLFEPPSRLSRGPVAEIEALQALVEDEQLVMVVIGESNTFLRRDLFLQLAGKADPETEEILQEISDISRSAGFRTLSIIG